METIRIGTNRSGTVSHSIKGNPSTDATASGECGAVVGWSDTRVVHTRMHPAALVTCKRCRAAIAKRVTP